METTTMNALRYSVDDDRLTKVAKILGFLHCAGFVIDEDFVERELDIHQLNTPENVDTVMDFLIQL